MPADRLKELVPVERESSAAEDLLEDSVVAIRAYLRQQGYWKADASWRREEAADALALVFQIKKGLRYYVAEAVALTGNQALTDRRAPDPDRAEAGRPVPRIGTVARCRRRSPSCIGSAASSTATVKYAVVRDRSATAGRRARSGRRSPSPKGPRTMVGTVRITGNAALSEAELRPLIKLAEGQPFYQPQVNADREAMIVDYLNNGFASADVTATPAFSSDRTRVDVTFTVQEGPADDRRSHPDRREQPHRSAGDPQRDEAQAGRAARPRGSRREPARA